jgi:hypothetical protein
MMRSVYACNRGWLDNGEARIAFGGIPVDEAIGREVLRAVHPAAVVEAAVQASQEETRRQDEVLEALRRDLEAARYTAQRIKTAMRNIGQPRRRSLKNWRRTWRPFGTTLAPILA